MVVEIIETMYKYMKVSMLFWMYLLKGAIVYGLIPSSCALLATMKEIRSGEDHVQISERFAMYYNHYASYRWMSFAVVFCGVAVYAILFFLNVQTGPQSQLLSMFFFYLFGLLLVWLTYALTILVKREQSVKECAAKAFVLTIKYLWISVFILMLLWSLFYIAKLNLVLFLVMAPCLYAAITSFLVGRFVVIPGVRRQVDHLSAQS
ncbi:DUF624 domain-containing protein [Caldalkalibacillus mannanilyticus]|uniref:DUF624 domain-containing protein n=1 Tax=Caldalkalibacillus mannanilyticus TaxID=1418 RepID=UPI00046AD0FE|nr:DUF624 domain-containing protein [Caldalkalibacillus mannanilyticus]